MTQNAVLELYGKNITIEAPKKITNDIYIKFNLLANQTRAKLEGEFYKIFSDLDDLYQKSDDIANDIRIQAVEEGMKSLASNGIYDIEERQFYESFMESYDHWDDELNPILLRYEAILEKSSNLDAHRTARRQNRAKWVGYGSYQSVSNANARNIISNLEHGVFNLVAKGVTAIGDAIKKDEIFKDKDTVSVIAGASTNLVMAGFYAAIDAISSYKDGLVHAYSDEAISKSRAIIDNVKKGRIPKENILDSLLKSIDYYPYNRDAFTLLLAYFGDDSGRIDVAADYFGILDFSSERKRIFDAQRKKVDLSNLDNCKKNLPALEKYARQLGYSDFLKESNSIISKAKRSAFDEKIAALQIKNTAELSKHISLLSEYAREIELDDRENIINNLHDSVSEREFFHEATKYDLTTVENCDLFIPRLEHFASKIGYSSFPDWAVAIRNKAKPTKSSAGKKNEVKPKKKVNPVYTLVLMGITGLIIFYGDQGFDYFDKWKNRSNKAVITKNLNKDASDVNVTPEKSESSAAKIPNLEKNEHISAIPQVVLSDKAKQAISEGFVEISDPEVKKCTENKIGEFKSNSKSDISIDFQTYNEIAVKCGFNI